ncbi:MAG: molybdopterin-binding protein [Chloroflexota bacterium]
MPSVEIITIGTEILLGEIVDTNAAYIARTLRSDGMDLFRKISVGDNAQRIAEVIRQSLSRCDVIITTGGLGPTVDDPTREAVALALGTVTEYHPELWEQIQERFRRYDRVPTENNKRQAYIPKGSVTIVNPVGTAPCFLVETEGKVIISLPGVPSEMEYLMEHTILPYLRQRYPDAGVLKIRTLHTAGVGESQIDELISDLETLSNPTVGLAAHSGQVDIRIVAKAKNDIEAEQMIQPVENTLRTRLNEWIYGADAISLEEVAMQALDMQGWRLVVVEAGVNGVLVNRLAQVADSNYLCGEVIPHSLDPDKLYQETRSYRSERGAEVGLGVTIIPNKDRIEIHQVLITPTREQKFTRSYGGPSKNAATWAANLCLNILRDMPSLSD